MSIRFDYATNNLSSDEGISLENTEVDILKKDVADLNEQLTKKISAKVVIEHDVDDDELVRMVLKDNVVQVLNK